MIIEGDSLVIHHVLFRGQKRDSLAGLEMRWRILNERGCMPLGKEAIGGFSFSPEVDWIFVANACKIG